MDKQLSNKIKICSLLLMIMVVFLHSYNIDSKQGGKILVFEKGFNWLLQNFISNGLTRIAVPLFFLISGYLFISKGTLDFQDYKIKVSKRLRTLVIPYLFWTLFGLFFYFILQSIPQSQGFFTKKLIKDYTFLEWINAIINEPIPYQLWFLKDLIVMVFISPIIYFLIMKFRFVFLLIVFAFWTCNQDTIFLTSEGLLFFSLGIYIQHFKSNIVTKQNKNPLALLLLWIVIVAIKTTIGFYDFPVIFEQLLLKLSIVIGIIAFWSLLDTEIFVKSEQRLLSKMTAFSFFIYVFHEPFLTIIKKALFSQLSKTTTSYLLVYITAPIVVITISILTSLFLRRWLSGFYKFITGNR